MKNIFIITISIIILSCNNITKIENIEKINSNLLYFNLELIKDINIHDDNEPELYDMTNLKVEYFDDLIYIKGFINTNACDYFKGNIEVEEDILKLKMENISNEVCMSCSKFLVRYIIKNKDKKKFSIETNVKHEIDQQSE